MRKSKLYIALVSAIALTSIAPTIPVFAGDNETEVDSGIYTTDNVDLYVWDNDTKDLIVSNDSTKYPDAVLVTEKKLNKIKECAYDSTWENALPQDMSQYLKNYQHLITADFSKADFTAVTNMRRTFNNCPNYMSLQKVNLSGANTSNVTDMSYLVYDCMNLTELDLSNVETPNVTDMSYIFSGCTSLRTIDTSSFDTSRVTTMAYMYNGDSSLTELNISNYDTSNVTDYSGFVNGCTNLASLDISGFTINASADTGSFNYFFNNNTKLDIIKCPKIINKEIKMPTYAGYGRNYSFYNETDEADSTIYSSINQSLQNKTLRGVRTFTIDVLTNGNSYKTLTVNNCRIGQQIDVLNLDDIGDISEYDLVGNGVFTVNADNSQNTATATLESKKFTVRFLNYDGTVLKTETVTIHGSATAPTDTPTKPDDSRHKYTFNNWDKEYSDITADTDITAQYLSTIKAEDLGDNFNIVIYILIGLCGAVGIIAGKKKLRA